MDKFSKKISFGGLRETMQNAQQELSTGLRSFTEKAKKEAKIANKKARKLMEVEDGGLLRNDYILSVNLSAGHDVFKKFQNNWVTMHEESITNVTKCDQMDATVNSFSRDFYKSKDLLGEFQSNLVALPDVLSKVEIAQRRLDAIAQQVMQIEKSFLEYEDACDRLDLERQKIELKVKLSQLVETKHAEYTLKKQIVEGKTNPSPTNSDTSLSPSRLVARPTQIADVEKRSSLEKQMAYQDAFMEQMNQYIQHGQVEKPIAGSANVLDPTPNNTDVEFEIGESDFSALSEFLGPEEMNSVLQASASQKKTQATSQQASTDTLTMTVEGDTNPDSADKDDDEVSREELRQNNKIISIPSDDQDASNEAIKTSSSKTQICDDKVKKQPEHVDGQNEKSISTSLSPQDTQQDDDSSTVEALQIDLQVDSSVTVVAQDIEPGEEDGGILMKDTTLDQTADDDEFFDADF